MLAANKEFSTLKGSEKRLDSLVVDIEDLLEELLSWAGHVKKQKKLLKQRRKTSAN